MIQAGFPQCDDFGMSGEVAEFRPDVCGRPFEVIRVPTNDGVNGIMSLGKRDGLAAVFQVSTDGDNASDAGGMGALEESLCFIGKIRERQMRVGVIEFRHRRLYPHMTWDFQVKLRM